MRGFRIRSTGPGLSFGLVAAVTLLIASLSTPLDATAHGPTRQKSAETIEIAAPADKVWAVMGNFDSLKNWHPAVASSSADKGNEPGSVRTVELKGGGSLVETLQKYDAGGMSYSYRAKDGGALPVTNYTSTISVRADGDKSKVEWRGAFYRAFPGNDPPPDQNDETAIKAITGVYTSGLANLKKVVEGK